MLAIVSASMYVQIKIGGSKSVQRVHRDELLDNVAFISRILKSEFIYRPGTVEENMDATLNYMVVCIGFYSPNHHCRLKTFRD
jgi:hypothetical protein